MRYCKKCKKTYDDSFIFCPECDDVLSENETIDISSKSKRKFNTAEENKVLELSNSTQKKNKNISSKVFHGKLSSRKRKTKIFLRILATILCLFFIFCGASYGFVKFSLAQIGRDNDFNSDNVGIVENQNHSDEILNIALFGTDSRNDDNNGRADAQMILSIDKKHNKIKIISIARDTMVNVENYGKQKITNAWRLGEYISKKHNGSQLAVKTLNQNFNLNIKDYVEVNFFGFVDIVDGIGGVDIDVDENEMKVMNEKYIRYMRDIGIVSEYIKEPGFQHLDGGQALAYSRDRYTGSDVTRGSRQREILIAIYNKLKDVSIAKYPSLISSFGKNCMTSLTDSEIMDYALWAVKNNPTIEQLSMPTDDLNAHGETIEGAWHFVYDLDKATEKIHEFIYETTETQEPVS